MNQESNNEKNFNLIFLQLDKHMMQFSTLQVLSELQTVVERVSFSGISDQQAEDPQGLVAAVEALFRGEVSDEMLDFVKWMAEKRALYILSDQKGKDFIDLCARLYKDVQELKFVTAVPLNAGARQWVIDKLRVRYPAPARINFEVSPDLIAGFKIYDKAQTVDKSLATYTAEQVPRYVSEITKAGN